MKTAMPPARTGVAAATRHDCARPPLPSGSPVREADLLRWVSIAGLVAFVFGVLTPVFAAIGTNLSQLDLTARLHVPAVASASPFGICADLCSSDGICRHVVVPGGWHPGSRVSDAQLADAPSCR